ncbi:MAG: hypothetical protein ABR560_07020, partial [Bacteroidales bacterium]
MLNLFGDYKGLEFFGTFEKFNGTLLSGAESEFSQYAVELIYRLGSREQVFGGARYNNAWNGLEQSVSRFQAVAGWFMTESIVLKLEYVNQDYTEFISNYGAEAG